MQIKTLKTFLIKKIKVIYTFAVWYSCMDA